MRIGRRETVADVLLSKAVLFNMASATINRLIVSLKIPSRIPEVRFGVFVRWHKCRDVGNDLYKDAITLRELEQLQQLGDADGATFIKMLSIMLQRSERAILRLQFISAYRYFLDLLDQIKAVGEAFESLAIPDELRGEDEGRAATELKGRGIADLVLQFTDLKPQFTYEQAYNLRWVVVFRELQRQWAKNMTERKQAKIMRERSAQTARRAR